MPRLLKQEEIILNTSQNIKSRDKGRKRERERERERKRKRERRRKMGKLVTEDTIL